ncbi:hypothetical protein [Flavobacterium subsaxonicum]|uniref:Uncharacterized protein n=1 Tax=Flavobacterium subsaxonicum WB 4.1-42 = DSM 21790 TaxID=1121898 RepID=A0A0A2MS82_9FLAO|nr:hypothetical protein [Flavobacterium subsaxonicum]KGO94313.1 hypothetical protein Q766_05180 [Flavobacterium subsaxonicum WB 4.1-42 = DSM 21790]
METVGTILHLIDLFLFGGYGLFTLVLIIASLFLRHHPVIMGLANAANRIIIFAGLAYLVLWMSALTISLAADLPEDERASLLNRIAGPYAWAYWFQHIFYITLSQLLWFKWIARNRVTRLLIGFLLFLNFEKFVILVTSLHRDYLPSSWSMTQGYSLFGYALLGLTERLLFYGGLCVIYYFVKLEIDKRRDAVN